jgi:butyrate kinase
MDAFIYQVACEIAKYGATLQGRVDRIIITGGIARSRRFVDGSDRARGFSSRPSSCWPGSEGRWKSLGPRCPCGCFAADEVAREY